MSIREDEFLALLNSAPVVNGVVTDTLSDSRMSRLRDDLHSVIRESQPATVLAPYLKNVLQVPVLDADGIAWTLDGPADDVPLAEVVLEWARVQRELPGRLRPCGNPDCNKFLIDHSKPNTARWCSMASCGNRMKARRFQARRATLA
jgi:hypothetical protein